MTISRDARDVWNGLKSKSTVIIYTYDNVRQLMSSGRKMNERRLKAALAELITAGHIKMRTHHDPRNTYCKITVLCNQKAKAA
jgi:hypothetical protein